MAVIEFSRNKKTLVAIDIINYFYSAIIKSWPRVLENLCFGVQNTHRTVKTWHVFGVNSKWFSLACEQALCLGKGWKIGRTGKGKGESL